MNCCTLKTAKHIPSHKEWAEKRYKILNEKINSFKDHKKYLWLRQYTDEAICYNSMCGYLQIKAEDFIKRIEKMPIEYIRGWLDGENKLEWKPEFE